ncbi:MAG: ABC transporter ATP-binding protein [Burkholderiales bacterium]|nr:ABC transporter ATP-binding protein [Burkholderiales bacterium]
MSEILLRVENLNFSYGAQPTLHNLNLQVSAGELFGLLGPNGAGKTTLITLMAGLLAPATGDIFIHQHSVKRERLKVRAELGLVFQSISLDKFMTAQENLYFAGGLYGLSVDSITQRIAELSPLLGLEKLLKRKVVGLSGGQQRMVDIARALIHQPTVLLLDEPTHGLDVAARQQVWSALKQLLKHTPAGRQPPAVLVSTHLMDEAATCDRVCFLKAGEIIWTGTPEEALAQLPERHKTVVQNASLNDWFLWRLQK